MKIKKIDFTEEGLLTVWTDQIPHRGFNFHVNDIEDKNDLKKKVKQRVKEFLKEIENKKNKKVKFDDLKKLEGQEI